MSIAHLPARARQRGGFTLMELIIVMGIIAFMAVGALVAFTQATRGGKLEKGRSILESFMRGARAYAISNNRNVLIVFAQGYKDERNMRSVAIYDVTDKEFVGDWTSLPQGIFFDKSAVATMKDLGVANPDGGSQDPAIWMRTNGSLAPTKQHTFSILEGIPSKSGTVYDYTPITGGRSLPITLNWQNGGVQ